MKDRNSVKAGLFIIITIALIVAVVISINGFGRFFELRHRYVANFKLSDDLGGLKIGDDIRIGGAKVGEVKSLHIDPDHDLIHVTFEMPSKYTVHQDAVLRVQGTVTGSSWLNFQSLGKGKPLTDDEPLAGQPSEMNELLASLSGAAPQIRQVLSDVHTQTVPRLNKALDNAGGAMAQVRDMLGPSKGDFHQTMANLSAATGTLKERIPGVMDKLHDALDKADTALTKIDGSMNNIRDTITNLKSASGSIRSLLTDNRSKLQGMVDSLKVTSDNLKGASADIWRSPWRLLYKPTKDEIGNLNLYDSTREFAQGANQLSEAAGALRDATHDSTVDRAHLQQLLDQLNKTFTHFNAVEQKLWDEVK